MDESKARGRALAVVVGCHARRKRDAVLRLLRGEDLDLVSRSLGVTAARLSEWRDDFLNGGEAALATREKDNRDLEIERLRAKLGEVLRWLYYTPLVHLIVGQRGVIVRKR